LHQVRRIDVGANAAIHTHGNHPPQPMAMAHEQLLAGCVVAPAGLMQQFVRVRSRVRHARHPFTF
jgi:hypothetical protein